MNVAIAEPKLAPVREVALSAPRGTMRHRAEDLMESSQKTEAFCGVAECERPVFRYGLCSSHAKQLQRRGWTGPIRPHESPEMRALEASIALVEADSDADYKAAHRRWVAACITLGRAADERRRLHREDPAATSTCEQATGAPA